MEKSRFEHNIIPLFFKPAAQFLAANHIGIITMTLIDPAYFELPFLCRMIGLVGVTIYVTGFFLLCSGRIDSTGPAYFCMNLAAASCVMVSLYAEFNLSAALIQSFYVLMSIGGIALRLRGWRTNRQGLTLKTA